MKLIKYISNTKLGRIGIGHTVVTYKGKYYSWESEVKLFGLFNNGKFVIYNEEEFKKDCNRILSIQEIPNIDMEKYCNLRKDGYNCIEIIDYIYKQEGMAKVGLMKRILNELGKFLYSITLVIIGVIIGLYVHNTFFVISENEYKENPSKIEFDK